MSRAYIAQSIFGKHGISKPKEEIFSKTTIDECENLEKAKWALDRYIELNPGGLMEEYAKRVKRIFDEVEESVRRRKPRD